MNWPWRIFWYNQPSRHRNQYSEYRWGSSVWGSSTLERWPKPVCLSWWRNYIYRNHNSRISYDWSYYVPGNCLQTVWRRREFPPVKDFTDTSVYQAPQKPLFTFEDTELLDTAVLCLPANKKNLWRRGKPTNLARAPNSSIMLSTLIWKQYQISVKTTWPIAKHLAPGREEIRLTPC